MTDPTVRVRFAPSPTGYLHVGGARTALFNWLFARKLGGRFILRIEDTDILRNIEGAEQKLLDDMKWLEIQYDEGPDNGGPYGPYRQSERRELYDAAMRQLLDSGQAYYAFDTPEELEAMRKAAIAKDKAFRYKRPDRLPSEADAAKARAEGRPVVVRFSIPDEPITIHDEILGDVVFPAGELDDLVIVKSNGWPTYHFAVVVDDYHMRISHVLRAQEHLMNTPKHVFMMRALGYSQPKFAHLPLVFNIDGSKMSKRDKHRTVRTAVKDLIKQKRWTVDDVARLAGTAVPLPPCKGGAGGGVADAGTVLDSQTPPLSRGGYSGPSVPSHPHTLKPSDPSSVLRWLDKADTELDMTQVARLAAAAQVVIPEIDVHDFRVAGYLPEALVNFVALIGWSPGDDREQITRQEMIDAFALSRINTTPGRFDRQKLLAFSTDYFSRCPIDRQLAAFDDYLALNETPVADATLAQRRRLLEMNTGYRTLRDVDEKSRFFFVADESIEIEEDARKKILDLGQASSITPFSRRPKVGGGADRIEPATEPAHPHAGPALEPACPHAGRAAETASPHTGRAMLAAILPGLESIPESDWTTTRLEAQLKAESDARAEGKLGKIAQPIRVALAGRTISPPIFETMVFLGRARTLSRIRRCAAQSPP